MASSRRRHLNEDQKEVWGFSCAGPKTFKYVVFPLGELGSPLENFEQKGEVI